MILMIIVDTLIDLVLSCLTIFIILIIIIVISSLIDNNVALGYCKFIKKKEQESSKSTEISKLHYEPKKPF